MRGLPIQGYDMLMGYQQKMQMFRHNHIILNLQHRIILVNTLAQLLLYHPPNGRQLYMRSIGSSVGAFKPPDYLSEGLLLRMCHTDGDMIIPASAVVVCITAPLHGVCGGF